MMSLVTDFGRLELTLLGIQIGLDLGFECSRSDSGLCGT